jgi:hypothetical protein
LLKSKLHLGQIPPPQTSASTPMDVQRKEDRKGDRVVVTMTRTFLPYKKW